MSSVSAALAALVLACAVSHGAATVVTAVAPRLRMPAAAAWILTLAAAAGLLLAAELPGRGAALTVAVAGARMSIPMYEPLQATPPVSEQHVRMAWLLQARQAARKALDAVRAAPRRAAGYLGRLAHELHLDAALSWLRRTTSYVTRPLTAAGQHLGRNGLLAAVTAVVTSPTGGQC